jgi:hypothetical protein
MKKCERCGKPATLLATHYWYKEFTKLNENGEKNEDGGVGVGREHGEGLDCEEYFCNACADRGMDQVYEIDKRNAKFWADNHKELIVVKAE